MTTTPSKITIFSKIVTFATILTLATIGQAQEKLQKTLQQNTTELTARDFDKTAQIQLATSNKKPKLFDKNKEDAEIAGFKSLKGENKSRFIEAKQHGLW